MIALGIDTSTPAGSVALRREERLLGEINLATGEHHQEKLLRSIDFLLDLVGLDISQVDLLAVALGPGTFTGLRVGIATVKGLAVATGVPAFGFSTLLALGHRYSARGLPVACMIGAGRGEVYSALYGSRQGD
ncbi:MAG: tRNA (adenosine(37)-N6)-threonylcarbamoyltransferase complex dimerization subunit type 1 TsaB, partial [Acidobacteria bacterium]|nr:tRNA (adenosine(37)-N6)-threonylcarbamoyltransferase complex dimerization subunit type 1 TsaB [Acidobacteriota bacterium]